MKSISLFVCFAAVGFFWFGVAGTSVGATFRFAPVNDTSLGLWEDDLPVLVYNHGRIHKAGVPNDRARSTYIHPLYGLDGEILTDDFPKDHYHHRGLFWAWPHVKVGSQEYDLWMLKGVEQKFERWVDRNVSGERAMLRVQNCWYAGEQKIMQETVALRVHAVGDDARAIDLEFTWTPQGTPITLAGAEGKSYGGLTLRFAPRTTTVITTPLGNEDKDLPMARLPWADLSARFAGSTQDSGAAIFVAPDHPDFPPMWLTRHYGVLCLGWPGVESKTFSSGVPIVCNYRVWVHRGAASAGRLEKAFAEYSGAIR